MAVKTTSRRPSPAATKRVSLRWRAKRSRRSRRGIGGSAARGLEADLVRLDPRRGALDGDEAEERAGTEVDAHAHEVAVARRLGREREGGEGGELGHHALELVELPDRAAADQAAVVLGVDEVFAGDGVVH